MLTKNTIDIERDYYCLSTTSVRTHLNLFGSTSAIIPVSLFGQPYDANGIKNAIEDYTSARIESKLPVNRKIYVIEDAAQAIDSYYTGRDGVKKPLGSIGHMAAFSFHITFPVLNSRQVSGPAKPE